MIHEHRHEQGEMGLTAGELEALAFRNQALTLRRKLERIAQMAEPCHDPINSAPIRLLLNAIKEAANG